MTTINLRPKSANTVTKVRTRTLPCKLTEEEKAGYGLENAQTVEEYTRTEEAKKEAAAEYTASLKKLRLKMNDLSKAINTGEEMREVDVNIRYDFDDRRVITTRVDTGEVIEDRPLSRKEAQTEMEMD